MKVDALISGGKDSMYATYLAIKSGLDVKYVVSVISRNPESYMFHVPNIELTKYQAKAMGIPLIQETTEGIKEEELEDLKKALEKIRDEIDGVVTGAVQSNYQKQRIDKICNELGLKSVAPLWQKNPLELIKQMVADGFEIIITAVAAPPLDEKWLGRRIDDCLNELIELNRKNKIHVGGEGGEYETFVLNCPLFNKKIEILDSVKHWDAKIRSGWLEIKKIVLK